MTRPRLLNFTYLKDDQKLELFGNYTFAPSLSQAWQLFSTLAPTNFLSMLRKLPALPCEVTLYFADGTFQVYCVETDTFGLFELSLPVKADKVPTILEIRLKYKKVNFYLNRYNIHQRKDPFKLIVCDFDRTLIETRYSNLNEILTSISSSLSQFEPIVDSIKYLEEKEKENFYTVILSASPNFYYEVIREWLVLKKIKHLSLILKDYRELFSLFWGTLRLKDIKIQGAYKLIKILRLLTKFPIPEELILIGDGHESDPLIYLVLEFILRQEEDPVAVWSYLKRVPAFNFSSSQDQLVLKLLYQLRQKQKSSRIKPKVIIRIKGNSHALERQRVFLHPGLKPEIIEYY